VDAVHSRLRWHERARGVDIHALVFQPDALCGVADVGTDIDTPDEARDRVGQQDARRTQQTTAVEAPGALVELEYA
jgi:hypothetical protein